MLIVLVFGMATLCISAESFSQRVLANIQPALQVIWPEAELSFGQLTIGLNESATIQLKVLANVGYSITLTKRSFTDQYRRWCKLASSRKRFSIS